MRRWSVHRGERDLGPAADEGEPMSVVAKTSVRPVPVPRAPLAAPHIHTWVLRAVEFDTWGQVSLYECEDCPSVRYV